MNGTGIIHHFIKAFSVNSHFLCKPASTANISTAVHAMVGVNSELSTHLVVVILLHCRQDLGLSGLTSPASNNSSSTQLLLVVPVSFLLLW